MDSSCRFTCCLLFKTKWNKMKAWKGEGIKFPALPISFLTIISIAFIFYRGLGWRGQKAQIYTHTNKQINIHTNKQKNPKELSCEFSSLLHVPFYLKSFTVNNPSVSWGMETKHIKWNHGTFSLRKSALCMIFRKGVALLSLQLKKKKAPGIFLLVEKKAYYGWDKWSGGRISMLPPPQELLKCFLVLKEGQERAMLWLL